MISLNYNTLTPSVSDVTHFKTGQKSLLSINVFIAVCLLFLCYNWQYWYLEE